MGSTRAIILEVRNKFEQLSDFTGGGGHLIGGTIVDLGIAKASHLDLGKDVRNRLVKSGSVRGAVVVS